MGRRRRVDRDGPATFVLVAFVLVAGMLMAFVRMSVVIVVIVVIVALVPMTVRLMPMAVPVLMAVAVAAGRVGAGLGLEGLLDRVHDQMHRAQHVGQHVIGLDLEVIGLQLDLHMAVAQVIRRAHQVEGRAMGRAGGDAQQGLRRRDHPHQRAVLAHQHVAAAHGRAARQEDAEFAPLAVHGLEAALLARVPVERHGGGALEQHRGQAGAARQQFGDLDHQTLYVDLIAVNITLS